MALGACSGEVFTTRALDAAVPPVHPIPTLDAATDDGGNLAIAPNFFDNCGGRIFHDGELDVAEYREQASAWSRAHLDCRLGPRFVDAYGTQQDERPTSFYPPRRDCAGTCAQAYPAYYQYGNPSPNSIRVGELKGQVMYFPDSPGVGIDEFTGFAFANNAIVFEPFISARPARYISFPFQDTAHGGSTRRPIAVSRSILGSNAGALAIFQNGIIGGIPDRYAVSSNRQTRLPDGFVPTAIASSNSNEFAFITAWNINTQTGHLFVVAIGDALPRVHAIREWLPPPRPATDSVEAASSEAQCLALGARCHNFDEAPFKVLGQIELPMRTPTDIAVSFDNGRGLSDDYLVPHVTGNYSWASGLTFDAAVRRRIRDQPPGDTLRYSIARSGYAVVLSRWEGKAVFVDLQPLINFVWQTVSSDDYDSVLRNHRGNAPNEWPFAFEHAPESRPVVVATVDIPHPTAVLAGRWHEANSPEVKAHIASLDGTIRTFHVGSLGTPQTTSPVIRHLFSTHVGPNPVAMAWRFTQESRNAAECPRASSCLQNNPWDFNHQFVVVSRARRELDFVTTTMTEGRIDRVIRDSRMDDPVAITALPIDPVAMFAVADFSGRSIINYRIGPVSEGLSDPFDAFPPGNGGAEPFECGGVALVEGTPYGLSIANVP